MIAHERLREILAPKFVVIVKAFGQKREVWCPRSFSLGEAADLHDRLAKELHGNFARNLGVDIMEFATALEDSKIASRAMFELCEQFAALGYEIEIDMQKAIVAQREVENQFFTIENLMKAEARKRLERRPCRQQGR